MKFEWKSKKEGQSIPIIAMMIVVLFAMVGLSVDVGNTYAEQRNVVRASDAAALAGMQKMIEARGGGVGDTEVATIIQGSLKSNGLVIAGADGVAPDARNQRQLTTAYLDDKGNETGNCVVGQCSQIPPDAKYIHVKLSGVVDTYFARVVGRQSLPVGADSYAAYCAPKDNVFPLAVETEIVDNGDKFSEINPPPSPVNGYNGYYPPGVYTDLKHLSGPYKEDAQYPFLATQAYWHRLFLTQQQAPTVEKYQLRLLSWKKDTRSDTNAFKKAFTGMGTMADGITEVDPWPANAPGKPDVYPRSPGKLDQGEWLYGYTDGGNTVSPARWSELQDLLRNHIQNRDALILPIIEKQAYSVDGTLTYKVKRLGLFRIANGESGVSINGDKYMSIDLAMLGPIDGVACLQVPPQLPPDTPPPPGSTSPAVEGRVFVQPTWKDLDGGRQPISYQVILDVSGSMNMDMYGNAYKDGKPVLCADPSTFGKVSKYPYDSYCNPSGDSNQWSPKEERRIYLAKDALNKFIDGMDKDKGDVMRVIAFSQGNQDLGGNVQVLPTNGWSGDTTALKAAVLKAGSYNNQPYLTQGGTPTPQALQQTLTLLQSGSAPKKFTDANNHTMDYKNVVILITDGMANVFLDGNINDADDVVACENLQPKKVRYNTVACQTGYSTANKQLRPVDAMIQQATNIKNFDPNLQLYVVGLSQVDSAGLENNVASNAGMYYRANDPDKIAGALKQIQSSTELATCAMTDDPEGYHASISGGNVTSYYGSGIYGYVSILDDSGNLMPQGEKIPIVQSPETGGKLGWSLPPGALAPGSYRLRAEVGYKDKNGLENHYEKIFDVDSKALVNETVFTVSSSSIGDKIVAPKLFMRLDPEVLFCPIVKN